MEGKKISFSFKKTKKVEKPAVEEKKDFIECVEEQSIKVVGGDTVEEATPLVIAMKPNTLVTAERLKQIAEEVERAALMQDGKEEPHSPAVKEEPCDETIEQMAVRELLQEAKKEVKVEGPGLVLVVPAQPKLKGQKESTIEDYESVPIQEFGLAMLRGMGWAPGKEKNKVKEPQLRPKGLGLGADTVLKQNQKKAVDKDGKELLIMKNAFVKVTTGKFKGCYGKVVSLDDDNGRVVVDLALKKQTVSLSEFMMTAVTKSEFDMQSRVINADKYEEYKRKEQTGNKSSKQDSSERESTSRIDDVRNRDRGREEKRGRERDEWSNRERESDRNKNREPERNRDRESEKFREPDKYRERDSEKDRDGEPERNRDSEKDRNREPERYRDRESEKDRNRESQRNRDRESQKDRYREPERDRESEKDRDRELEKDRDREHERNIEKEREPGSSNGRNRERDDHRRDSSSSEDRSKHRKRDDKKRYSSQESLSSESEEDRAKKHKKSKKRKSSTDSDSSDDRKHKKSKKHKRNESPKGKRDIDKKRKGKKKKRDRDRSPNYKKHRK